ncbi:MAG TPA: molybdenum cofactor guanylyltransferase [Ktedonobacterales bacterium]|nr:molybdenum cofactor guanylyltransferase [Ktedonobacterales bacterium]
MEGNSNLIAEVTGVVLAGGRSRRMGRDKAALPIDGVPLLQWVVTRLQRALADVIVIGPREAQSLAPTTRVIPDATPGAGPLAALATALAAITTPYAFVVACDMPCVQPALIRAQAQIALMEAAQVVALRTLESDKPGLEPLHAVYARACLPEIEAQLAVGEPGMRYLLARLQVREIKPDERARYDPQGISTLNVNTPDEWARALDICQPMS